MRVHNFNAGPAALPEAVLKQVQAELLDLDHTGMSVMEMSHRSSEFESYRDRAEAGLRDLLGLPDDYSVLFLQGGASLQFSMVPMNVLGAGESADYIVHGSWGVKALQEAEKVGAARQAASTEVAGFKRVPTPDEIEIDPNAKYVHLTTNETIEGVQWAEIPDFGPRKIIADMSSDILSCPINVEKYGLIYAGAQKNIGPSGVTVVIVRNDWIEKKPELPTMLSYAIHDKNKSLYNTPNTFGIYMIALVCDWIKAQGGLEGMEKRSVKKSALIYDAIDSSEFYQGFAEKNSRSQMNVTFRLPNEELESKFASTATKSGFIGLKGHRSVGGLRASIYNAVEPDSVRALVEFMREFERTNG